MILPTDKVKRKETPIARGCLDYFPDAIAAVAHLSYVGNQQHNPGEPMHWARGKSDDHADCLVRHTMERGKIDTDGQRHSVKAAWRALAMAQLEIEGDEEPENIVRLITRDEQNAKLLQSIGCPNDIAAQIVGGMSYTVIDPNTAPYVYIAGPMRGHDEFNFPEFDWRRNDLLQRGFHVISPADIDRASGDVNQANATHSCTQADFAFRDFLALYLLSREGNPRSGIFMLPGWENSTGAKAEYHIAKWLGLSIYGNGSKDRPAMALAA